MEVRGAPEVLVSADARGFITDWNEQAEAFFGWTKEAVLGRSLAFTIVPPRHREAHVAGFARYLATGRATILDQRVVITAMHADGREFPVEIEVMNAGEGPTRFRASFRIVRERDGLLETGIQGSKPTP